MLDLYQIHDFQIFSPILRAVLIICSFQSSVGKQCPQSDNSGQLARVQILSYCVRLAKSLNFSVS